jgi:hypothetical protein
VAAATASAKRMAKRKEGCSLFIERRSPGRDLQGELAAGL